MMNLFESMVEWCEGALAKGGTWDRMLWTAMIAYVLKGFDIEEETK